jgi:hypothetical protein
VALCLRQNGAGSAPLLFRKAKAQAEKKNHSLLNLDLDLSLTSLAASSLPTLLRHKQGLVLLVIAPFVACATKGAICHHQTNLSSLSSEQVDDLESEGRLIVHCLITTPDVNIFI